MIVWIETEEYNKLYLSDGEILLHSAAWLTDRIISAAQSLLRQLNP